MKQTKKQADWTLNYGRRQNAVAESGLRLQMKTAPRELTKTASAVREAANAVLRLVYQQVPSSGPMPKPLAKDIVRIISHANTPHHHGRLYIPLEMAHFSLPHVRRVQRITQTVLAGLWLQYDPQAEGDLIWNSLPFRARFTYVRTGSYLLYDIINVQPQWQRLMIAVCAVLKDATAWLRFCELCGRMFFKVKRQILCSNPRCKAVYHARRRLRKGADDERRGRPRIDFAAETETIHNRWIRVASENDA